MTRPLDKERERDGVFRPLTLAEVDVDGVALPDNNGVVRPLRFEATDEGRDIDPTQTVGGESFEAAMKTPQLDGQVKYRLLNGSIV